MAFLWGLVRYSKVVLDHIGYTKERAWSKETNIKARTVNKNIFVCTSLRAILTVSKPVEQSFFLFLADFLFSICSAYIGQFSLATCDRHWCISLRPFFRYSFVWMFQSSSFFFFKFWRRHQYTFDVFISLQVYLNVSFFLLAGHL